MFMMLGRAEKAGSGVDKILSGWNDLGWSTPVLTEELQPDYVVLTLPVGKAKTHQENPSRNSKMSSKVEAKIKLILEFCSEPKSFIEIMVCGGCRRLLLSAFSGSFASVIDSIRGCRWR